MPKEIDVEKIEVPLKKWNELRASSGVEELLKSHTALVDQVEVKKEDALVPLQLLAAILAIPSEPKKPQYDSDIDYMYEETPRKKAKPAGPSLYDKLIEEEREAKELKELVRLQDQLNREEAANFLKSEEGIALVNFHHQLNAQPIMPPPPPPVLPPIGQMLPQFLLPPLPEHNNTQPRQPPDNPRKRR